MIGTCRVTTSHRRQDTALSKQTAWLPRLQIATETVVVSGLF